MKPEGPFCRMSRDGRLLALKCEKCGRKMSGPCIVPVCKPCGGVDYIIIHVPRSKKMAASYSKRSKAR